MEIPSDIEEQRALLKDLASRPADPGTRQAIESILASRMDLPEKIQAVHELLQQGAGSTLADVSGNQGVAPSASSSGSFSGSLSGPEMGSSPGSPPGSPPGSSSDSPPGSSSGQELGLGSRDQGSAVDQGVEDGTGIRDIQKNRRRIKRSLTENGFFSYVLGDLWRIIPFVKETRAIEARFFYLMIRVNRNIADTYPLALQRRTVMPLLEILRQISQRAWIYLEKSQYNLLALLRELCERVVELDFQQLPYEDRKLVDRFRRVEELYYALRILSPDLSETIAALRAAYQNMPELPASIGTAATLAQRLLGRSQIEPSFEDFLLALNMVGLRRFLSLEDLIKDPEGPLVSMDEFDAADHIQRDIRYYLKELEARLKLCLKRAGRLREESQEEAENLPLDELRNFYGFRDVLGERARDVLDPGRRGTILEDGDKGDFEEDRRLPLKFLHTFLKLYLKTFTPLLSGSVKTSGGSRQLFSQEVFSQYLERLRLMVQELDQMPQAGAFPLLRLEKLLKQKDHGQADQQALRIFTECLACLKNIHGILNTLMRKHDPGRNSTPQAKLGIRQIQEGKLSLPWSQESIEQQDTLMGKTVSEGLSYATELGGQVINLFRLEESEAEPAKGENLEEEISRIIKTMSRIGSSTYLRATRSRYQLPAGNP